MEEEVEERACLDLCSLVVFEELVSFDNLPFYLIHLSSRSVFKKKNIYIYICIFLKRLIKKQRDQMLI